MRGDVAPGALNGLARRVILSERERVYMADSKSGGGDVREALWGVPRKLRPAYAILFVGQALAGIAYRAWHETAVVTHDTFLETAESILKSHPAIGAIAAFNTFVLMEVYDFMLGTSRWIQERFIDPLEERGREAGRKEGIAAGREEGIVAGREEGIAAGREEGIAAGREEGIAAGREEAIAEANRLQSEWQRRREDAAARGEPFDEPPPTFG